MIIALGILILVTFIFLVYVLIYYGRQAIFTDAVRYYKTGDVKKALTSLKSYKAARPADIRAKKMLAKIYYEQNDLQNALKEYLSITFNRKSNPEEKGEAFSMISKIYMDQKDYPKATDAIIKGLKANPKNPNLFCYLGQIYSLMGKEKKALKVYNESLKIDRSHVPTRLELARLHINMKNRFKARFQFRKVLEIDQNNDEARFELAHLLYNEGEIEDAAEIMELLRDITGRERDYYTILYNYHKEKNNVERMEFLVNEMLELPEVFSDMEVTLNYDKGCLHESKEEFEKAYEAYKKVKELNPRYKDIENKLQNLTKMLYPEEYTKMLEGIDYSKLNSYQLAQVFEGIIERLGLKLTYELEQKNDKFLAMAADQFNPKDRFLVQLLVLDRSTTVRDLQIFMAQFEENKATNGIYITTNTYNEQAVTYAESVHNLEILDKVHIYDLVGEIN